MTQQQQQQQQRVTTTTCNNNSHSSSSVHYIANYHISNAVEKPIMYDTIYVDVILNDQKVLIRQDWLRRRW